MFSEDFFNCACFSSSFLSGKPNPAFRIANNWYLVPQPKPYRHIWVSPWHISCPIGPEASHPCKITGSRRMLITTWCEQIATLSEPQWSRGPPNRRKQRHVCREKWKLSKIRKIIFTCTEVLGNESLERKKDIYVLWKIISTVAKKQKRVLDFGQQCVWKFTKRASKHSPNQQNRMA